jgi:PAS domain S-box-containing protein
LNNNQTYQAFFEAGSDAIIITRPDGKIELANQSVAALFGYTKSELNGKAVGMLIPGLDPHYQNPGSGTFTARTAISYKETILNLFIRRKDGSEFPAEIRISTLDFPQTRMVAFTIRDISERKKIENQLAETESRVRTTFDLMGEGAMVISPEWRYLYVNDVVARQGKYKKEELIGHTVMEMYPEIEKTELFRVFQESMTLRVINHIETNFLFPDNSETWFRFSIQPVPEGIFVISFDISDRKKAEDLLAQSEKKYRDLFENNPQPMWIYDRETLAFLNVNEAAISHYGYSKNEFLKMTLTDIRPTAEKEELMNQLFKSPSHLNYAGTWKHKKKNGEIILADIRSHALVYERREARLVLVHDITEQRKAALLLLESEQRYKQVVENVSDAIIIDDKNGKVVFANKRFLELYGRSQEELENLVLEDYVAPEFRETLRDWHNRRIAGEDVPELFEYQGLHKNGDKIWVEVQVTKVVTDGKITGTQSAIRDIRERKKAELNIRNAMRAIQKNNKELEQFAYMVSHDLQEPLRMVGGFLNLLQSELGEKLTGSAKEYIDYAMDGSTRMKRMIEDLLQYSRVASNKETETVINLNELLDYVLLVFRDTIEKNGVNIRVNPLPEIKANKTLVSQLFMNLVGNALKYGRPESPEIEIGFSKETGENIFYVRDNGIGIEEKFFEKIFIIFQRAHDKKKYSGTGIGLAICKKIVERHGGNIWLESAPAQGSTFYFTLPNTF